MKNSHVIKPRSYSEALADAARKIEDDVWESLGYLNFTKAHRQCYDDVLVDFADLQLCLVDEETEEPIALANCVPAVWSMDRALPATGWDWLVEDGGRKGSKAGNVLGALAISVPSRHRKNGHASRMIGEMKRLCRDRGFDTLIAPVRPSHKHLHPRIPMEDYLRWTDDRARCFDPWLRSHLAQGGRQMGICGHSMVVDEPIAFWETWAGRRFTSSGGHAIEGGLVPLEIDLLRGAGRYEEPNVWVAYRH